MPPEAIATPDTPRPIPESPSPAIEAPAPATESTTHPQEVSPTTTAIEAPPASVEVTPAPETALGSSEDSTSTQPTNPTAQIPPNEPIAPESDPIEPAPEPPAAASAPAPVIAQTGILRVARELLAKARVSIQDRKRKKRDKIMLALNTKNKITNDEVEKLLHVSDATATRYLSALVKEGKLKQEKRTGAGVTYSRAQ